MFLEKTVSKNVFFMGAILCKNVFRMLEQPVKNKGYSSVHFLLRLFYQVFWGPEIFLMFYKGQEISTSPHIKFFLVVVFYFLKLELKSGPVSCIYYYHCHN